MISPLHCQDQGRYTQEYFRFPFSESFPNLPYSTQKVAGFFMPALHNYIVHFLLNTLAERDNKNLLLSSNFGNRNTFITNWGVGGKEICTLLSQIRDKIGALGYSQLLL